MKFRIISVIRLLFVLMLIPLIGLLVYINIFAIGRMTEETIDSHERALQIQVDKIDKNLMNCSAFVRNMLVNNNEIAMTNLSASTTETCYLFMEIQQRINEFAILDNGMNEFFFWAPDASYSSYYNVESKGVLTSGQRHKINEHIQERIGELKGENNYSQWEIHEVDGAYCLIFIMKQKDIYMGAWCLTDNLLSDIPLSDGSEQIVLAHADGTVYTGSIEHLDVNQDSYATDGREYIQLKAKIGIENTFVVDIVDRASVTGSLLLIKNVIWVIFTVLIILLIGTYVGFNRMINRPVRRLLSAMEQVRGGDRAKVSENVTPLEEFQIINRSFNQMVDEIQDLKIQIYEEQLREKETKLQYLQIQIRPHFLVNVLNLIYSMAEVEEYKGIQSLTMYLVKYFRFMFTKSSARVTVAEELEHVHNYMGIQEARFPDSFHFHANVDEDTLGLIVPPLTIQSFIENSIKYALNLERENDIWLDIHRCDDGYEIVIRDSGGGFDAGVMESINAGKVPEMDDSRPHIGIYNVVSRLELIYGKRAWLKLENDGGAMVTIHLPAQIQKEAHR